MSPSQRILIYQESLPDYRLPFLNALAQECELLVLYGGATPLKDVKPDVSRIKGFRAVELQRKGTAGGFLSWHMDLFHQIREFDPHAIISEPRLGLLGVWHLAYSKEFSDKLIWWLSGHEPEESKFKNRLRRIVRRRLYPRSMAFITYGSHGREYLRSMGMKQDVFIAYNSVGSEEISFWRDKLLKDEVFQANKDKYRSSGSFSLLYVGRMSKAKNVLALPDIIEELAPDCSAEQIGIVVIGDGDEMGVLKQKVVQKNLGQYFRFTGALYGTDELAPWFMAADAFVLPGKGGLAINEAVQYGLPVLTANADGTEKDLVSPGMNGEILPFTDPQGFAKVINDWRKDPEKLEIMGKASLNIALDRANTGAMKEGFLKAVSSIQNQKDT